jgi:hypothetical protein
MWNLISSHLEKLLMLVLDGSTVCAQLEPRVGPYGDSVSVGAR